MDRIARKFTVIFAMMAAIPISAASPITNLVFSASVAAKQARSDPSSPATDTLVNPVQSMRDTLSAKDKKKEPEAPQTSPPRISALRLAGVEPEKPTAGQLAQLSFEITVIGQVPPTDEGLKILIDEGIFFTIDGRAIRASSDNFDLVYLGRSPAGATVVGTAATITWPEPPEAWAKTSSTINSRLELRAKDRTVRPSSRLVQVSIQGNETFLWLSMGLGTLFLALAGFYVWWNRQRRTPDTDRFGNAGVGLNVSSQVQAVMSSGAAQTQSPTDQAQIDQAAASQGQVPIADALPLVPEDLAREIAEGRGVLVLGPGASAAAGVPAGKSLLLKLVEQFDNALPPPLSSVPSAKDPAAELDQIIKRLGGVAKVFDVVAAATGRDKLSSAIATIVDSDSAGGTLFGALAQCPWNSIVSLTYDRLAERAFIEQASPQFAPMRVVTITDAADLPSSSRGGDRLLFKAFGDLDRPPTLAFTLEEMRRLFLRSPAYQRSLAGLYQSHMFLFLGVDSDSIEQFIQAITPEFESAGPKHYALVQRDSVNSLYQTSLARFGMRLLEFDAGQSALPEFARQIRNRVRTMGSLSSDSTGSTFLSPARIARVKLESIGPFDRLELRFEPANPHVEDSPPIEAANPDVQNVASPIDAATPDVQSAPWSVIFGPNGVGKSTILRAIALVLAGDHPAAVAAGGRLLRSGAKDGLIEVQIGTQILKTRLTRDLSTVVITSLQQTPVGSGAALALGFPALRGARSPDVAGPSQKSEPRDPEPADLVALIAGEVDPRLSDFKQWLVNTLVLAGQQNPRAMIMCDLLDKIISDLVPGQIDGLAPLDQGDFVIRVRTPEGLIPFDDLSQGMASIFNWVGLLAQRLFSICESSADPSHEPAIVLIDEIDAHLHPEWQRRLVDLTRLFFPNVQVIATSHSSLMAGALRAHELIVLERDPETKVVKPLPYMVDLYGLRSQDILTSAAFGLSSDRAPAVEHKRAEYFDLLQKLEPTASDQMQMEKLAEELAPYRIDLKPKLARKAALPKSISAKESARIVKELAALDEVTDPARSVNPDGQGAVESKS